MSRSRTNEDWTIRCPRSKPFGWSEASARTRVPACLGERSRALICRDKVQKMSGVIRTGPYAQSPRMPSVAQNLDAKSRGESACPRPFNVATPDRVGKAQYFWAVQIRLVGVSNWVTEWLDRAKSHAGAAAADQDHQTIGRDWRAHPDNRDHQCPLSEVRTPLQQPLIRTSESHGHRQTYDSSAAFRFEVPGPFLGLRCRDFKSAALGYRGKAGSAWCCAAWFSKKESGKPKVTPARISLTGCPFVSAWRMATSKLRLSRTL